MPRFSVLIPAYNVEPYIDACLESVCSQSFRDFEVIVVDDASTDGTAARLTRWEQKDERIRVITHAENQGRHSARKTAVEASTGEYCFFLDSDDEIAPRLYELMDAHLEANLSDMVRYGIEILPESPEDHSLAFDYAKLFNHTHGDMEGDEILLASYSPHERGFVTWSMVTTLWRGDMLREAFAEMPHQRLARSEDAYEYLVAASKARIWRDLTAMCGYRYHIGRGISSRAVMPQDRFVREQKEVYEVDQAVQAYAAQHPRPVIKRSAEYFRQRSLEMIAEDLRHRLRGDDLVIALEAVEHTWGREDALTIAFSLTLGRGNWLKAHNLVPDIDDHFNVYQRFLNRMAVNPEDPRLQELDALNTYFEIQTAEEQRRREEEAKREQERAARAEREA